MKKQELLAMSGYKIVRIYRGNDWNGKKKYYYLLRMKDGTEYRIRKYDIKDFLEKGATYEEIN